MAAYAVVGSNVPRIEGQEKVIGAARFTADFNLPGVLWAKILRSPMAHARLVRIDTTNARAVPGVRAVITGADIGDLRIGAVVRDMPVLCTDYVRFIGDQVAAVAADDPDTADEALNLIEVDYEELPVLTDPIAALQESSPRLHPDVQTYRGRPDLPDIPNLQGMITAAKGDLEQGFAEADLVFEHTFSTSLVHQGYLESRACAVQIEEDGTVSVWTSSKVPYQLRDTLADLLGMAKDKVVVQRVHIGGDFGGKGSIGPEPVAYFLAKATGQPVRYVPTYAEELQAGNPRHPMFITLRTGVTRDGRMVAREALIIMNGGAYGAHKVQAKVHLPSVVRILGPYRIPHTRIDCRIAYTNCVPGGVMRAPGQPQVIFAGESQIDLIAQALGLDPIEFRLRNIIEEGDVWPDGARFTGVAARETLTRVREACAWDAPLGPNRGRGVAITERPIPSAPSGVVISVGEDGRATVLSAVPDVGTGAFTILRQIVAEQLHLPLDAVSIVTGDTNHAPLDAGIGGSKTTFTMTTAAVDATDEIKAQVAVFAAERMECAVDDLEIVDGRYQVKGYPESAIPALDLFAEAATHFGGRLEGRSAGPGQRRAPQSCSVATVVEVEVDPETGQVVPVKVTTAVDVGKAINPQLVQAQIDGTTTMGIGMALTEEIQSEDGRISTVNLDGYKLPTCADIPEVISTLVEAENGPPPYGAKGVGELGHCPIPAATANAIARACGARVQHLPLTAERVWEAIAASREAVG